MTQQTKAKIAVALFAALGWGVVAIMHPVPVLIASAVVAAAALAVLVSAPLRAQLWGLVGRPAPVRAPFGVGLSFLGVAGLGVMIAVAGLAPAPRSASPEAAAPSVPVASPTAPAPPPPPQAAPAPPPPTPTQTPAPNYKEAIAEARQNVAGIRRLLTPKKFELVDDSAFLVATSYLDDAERARPGDKVAAKLRAELEQLKAKHGKLTAQAAEAEARRDLDDFVRLAKKLGREAGYITNVRTGEGGHQQINVYVNHFWHIKPKTVKEEQIRTLEQRFGVHLEQFHPGRTPYVSIYDQSGSKIGGTGLFGASAD